MKRILYASDFSKASRATFKKAIEMAKTTRATLHLLHVMAVVPILGDGYVSPKTYDQISASETRWARQEMERLVKKARAAGVKTTSTIVQGGRPHRPGRARQACGPRRRGDARPHRLLAISARQRGFSRGRDVAMSRADRARQIEGRRRRTQESIRV
jgi:hypothetical protein